MSLNSQWFQNYKTACQIWWMEKNLRFSTKTAFFSIVQLWRLVFLEPLGVQRRNVPHFKGLINAKVDLEAQGRDSTFTFCHAQLKKAILHHTRASGRFVLSKTVGQDPKHQTYPTNNLCTMFRWLLTLLVLLWRTIDVSVRLLRNTLLCYCDLQYIAFLKAMPHW